MNTFMSSTDLNTLKEEGIDRNHFVSLIVNNEGTYTAAITRKIRNTKSIVNKFWYSSFGDEVIEGDNTEFKQEEELEYYFLDITIEKRIDSYSDFKDRLDKVKKDKINKITNNCIQHSNNVLNFKPSLPINTNTHKDTKEVTTKTSKESNGVLPIDWGDDDYFFSYDSFKFNSKIIKSLVLQLITGSIILSDENKIDVEKWAKNMPILFEKRFGKGEAGLLNFKMWAEGYIEYLCWFTKDPELEELELEEDYMSSICANSIIEELEKLPNNKYLDIYIELLNTYLI